ncbi:MULTISPECIES: PHP domain-containing protein [unclassified Legionella]|uniref:PHP domain-containing protein n=1 Tax=unclassified Legionella TaxID=2622702 RepID=UPI001055B728|nr:MULTISPECIES: PHP domain-containing protein [unclassified Legionella]MDI9818838.1 PHP domain-containing protein [Legionella sp. PL877]
MIDLHCHSNFSDGRLSPAALLNKAVESKIKILALTDHDTTAGLKSLHDAADNSLIRIINGIEFSVLWKKHEIHIVGLNINPQDPGIQALISRQNESRITRALQIAEQMKYCGIDEAYSKACKIAGHERVGRPHFAQVLVSEGLVCDIQTAFKRFLGRGKAAYVQTPWLSLADAVGGIKKASGEPVLAHPLKYGLTRTKLHTLLEEFKEVGGTGLEVVSGEMTQLQIQAMAGLCQRFQLLGSTGSDYHGDGLSRLSLGGQQQFPINCKPIWQQWDI